MPESMTLEVVIIIKVKPF